MTESRLGENTSAITETPQSREHAVQAAAYSFPSEWLTDDYHGQVGALAVAAVVEWLEAQREPAIVSTVKKCPSECMTAGWRGLPCPYHDGFIEGLDSAIALLEGTYRMDTPDA